MVIEAQKRYFRDNFGDAVKINYVKSPKELNLNEAIFVSNEIFDAFPCELYKDEKIAVVNDFNISWVDAEPELLEFAKRHRLRTGE